MRSPRPVNVGVRADVPMEIQRADPQFRRLAGLSCVALVVVGAIALWAIQSCSPVWRRLPRLPRGTSCSLPSPVSLAPPVPCCWRSASTCGAKVGKFEVQRNSRHLVCTCYATLPYFGGLLRTGEPASCKASASRSCFAAWLCSLLHGVCTQFLPTMRSNPSLQATCYGLRPPPAAELKR